MPPHATPLHAVVTLLLYCLATFFSLPTLATAQNQTVSYPDRVVHGWSPSTFVPSPDPATAHLLYVLDGNLNVVVVDARDGRVVRSAAIGFDAANGRGFDLYAIAVDSRGYVFVTTKTQPQLIVLDSNLKQITNVSFSTLTPSTTTTKMLVVIDSTDNVYLVRRVPE